MARIGSLGASLRSAWAQNNPINLAWPVLSAHHQLLRELPKFLAQWEELKSVGLYLRKPRAQWALHGVRGDLNL